MMTSSVPTLIESFTMMIVPLLYLGLHVLTLGACIFGAMQPSLRREFLWLGAGAFLSCVGSVVSLIPQVIRMANSDTSASSYRSMSVFYSLSSGIHVLAMLLFAVGFILLALRARSLPVFGR
jgi:hypothetical protein